MDLAPVIYPLLFIAALIAGAVDAIAGGGGIITVPVLLNAGFPVPLALGTNKLQSSFGSVTAAWSFVRGGVVDLRACWLGIAATLLGSAAGALVVRLIDNAALAALVPWLLGAIVVYSIFRPQLGAHDHPPRMREALFFTFFGVGLGFYDGFFGPGTGSFWTMALVAVMGFNFIKATGCTKVMNATSNLASLAVFFAGGQVDLAAGLVMGAGQMIGARIGARLVVAKGARFVRPVFLTMAVLTVARLLWVTHAK